MEQKEGIAALAKAQSEMGAALKNSKNPHFKSKYADLASVREACFPALNSNGFAVIQKGGADEVGEFVDTILAHASGWSESTRVYLKIGKADMQGLGSARTYARRYGLMELAGIAPEDDDGHAASQTPAPSAQAQRPARSPLSEGIAGAWEAAILDKLPADATSFDRAKAFAAQIKEDLRTAKAMRFLDQRWNKRWPWIEPMIQAFPDLHAEIVDAYEIRQQELTDAQGIAAE